MGGLGLLLVVGCGLVGSQFGFEFSCVAEVHAEGDEVFGGEPAVGDHDASGVSMFLAYLEEVEAFTRDLGGQATFTRLAVIPEQTAAYDLPTAPPKPTDKRAFAGQTCQAEALAPDVLANILLRAIEERLDRRAYDKVLRREQKIRRELSQRFAGRA